MVMSSLREDVFAASGSPLHASLTNLTLTSPPSNLSLNLLALYSSGE